MEGSQRLKKLLDWVDEDDGAFWMSFSDFTSRYSSLYTCKIFAKEWHHQSILGEWKGKTAAGCTNFGKWADNPQYFFEVKAPSHVFMALSQEDRRGERDFHSIVLTIHKKNGKRALRMNELLTPMESYTNLRTRTVEIPRVEPGIYTLVPRCI